MKILRRYQLDIIFLFIAFIILVGLSFYAIEKLNSDPNDYQWFISLPLMALYTVYLLSIRDKIKIADRRSITSKSLLYWVVLGIVIIVIHMQPLTAKEYWSINLFFLIFTLMLADSYWDFKNINLRSIAENKKKLNNI